MSETNQNEQALVHPHCYPSLDIDGLKLLMSETLNELEWKNRGALPEVRKFKRRIEQMLNIERDSQMYREILRRTEDG
jgi:hypothetical protein